MNDTPRNWGDLGTRIASALVMAIIGIGALMLGGSVLFTLIALVTGVMIWELARLLSPEQSGAAYGLAFSTVLLVSVYEFSDVFPIWIAAMTIPVAGAATLRRRRVVFFLYATVILVGGIGIWVVHQNIGNVILVWLVTAVVVTDIAGYFVGRLVGGPKFWPRISPKKTWSGTIGGWVGAGLVGWYFAISIGLALPASIVISVMVSLASQLGDIAESAIKRSVDAKDSSNLIPGHGGFMDRFDGMYAAGFTLFVALFLTTSFPVLY